MPYEYKEILMHNIRYLRRQHRLTKSRMAALLRVGVGTINKIEQGVWPKNLPGLVLMYLHRHFDVDYDALLSCRLDEEGAPPSRLCER